MTQHTLRVDFFKLQNQADKKGGWTALNCALDTASNFSGILESYVQSFNKCLESAKSGSDAYDCYKLINSKTYDSIYREYGNGYDCIIHS